MIDWIKKEKEIKLKSKDLKEDEIVVNLKPEPIFLPISKILMNDSFNSIQKSAYDSFVLLIENEGRDLIKILDLYFPDLLNSLKEGNSNHFDILKLIGCDSKIQFLTLFLQNRLQRKTSDRKWAYLTKIL